MSASILQLECDTKSDPWGKIGADSLAAKYASAAPAASFRLQKGKPYSEMWMGTYPSLPARLLSDGEQLQHHLNDNAQRMIGERVLKKYGKELPFIPKILSIAKALPLQIHPNMELAAKLHQEDSGSFTDSNHKPEIAIALGKFEAFVGFKKLSDIQYLWEHVSILKNYIQPKTPDNEWSNETVKGIVRDVLKLEDGQVKELFEKLKHSPQESYGEQKYIMNLLGRLEDQYGTSDPGSLVAVLTMNFLTLQRGESLYIPADGIHAYLSGDIMECMARSDNMLATGMCPKAERNDVEPFVSAITYDYKGAENSILKPQPSDKSLRKKTQEYAPPLGEFKVLDVQLEKGEVEELRGIDGPGILTVVKGSGRISGIRQDLVVKEGYVFFIGQGTGLEFVADEDSEGLQCLYSVCEA